MTAPPPPPRQQPGRYPAGAGGRLHSPSFERNAAPIGAALAPLIGGVAGSVLEIGSGSGQHALGLACAFPHLRWVPSDPDPAHRASIAAWRAEAGTHAAAPNLAAPLDLDAAAEWAARDDVAALGPLAAVIAINVIHIAPWRVAEGIVAGAARVMGTGGWLIFYGPFAEGGQHTGEGNARFDAALRAENPGWGVRDLGEVAALAHAAGFGAPQVTVMPANNRLVAFARG